MARTALESLERDVLDMAAGQNENLTLTVTNRNESYVYVSRMLEVHFKKKFIIIDEASIDSENTKPLSKGEKFEVFFQFKGFRYLFDSIVLEHIKYNFNNRPIYALKIQLPTHLRDGERREYFRVGLSMKPPVHVKFNIFKKGEDTPIMSAVVAKQPEIYDGIITDISGGGFAIKAKEGSTLLDKSLEQGDIINAQFLLKQEYQVMEIYSEVRSKHKYKGTEITIWGLMFLPEPKNRHLKNYRNKILRFVTERQRQLMAMK